MEQFMVMITKVTLIIQIFNLIKLILIKFLSEKKLKEAKVL